MEKIEVKLKINYIGIIGGVLAFISLALPWWTSSVQASVMGMTTHGEVSVYPYLATATAMGVSGNVIGLDIWFGWAALALIIPGGVLGIIGSIVQGKKYDAGKKLLIIGGVFSLLSIIIFSAGLQYELLKAPSLAGWPSGGLFSSGSYQVDMFGVPMSISYTTYLSFGFWLALASAVLMFYATKEGIKIKISAPPPP